MGTWTDEHARLVADVTPAASDLDLDRTWTSIQAGMESTALKDPRRKIRVLLVGGVCAAVVSASGAAVAGILSARTGQHPDDAESLRLGGPGERLNPTGDDFRDVLREETRDIPFPSAAARDVSIDEHVRDLQSSNGSVQEAAIVSVGAVRGWTAVHAVCAWSNEWVMARRTGDNHTETRAAHMLVEAHTWPAITALDSVQENKKLTMEVRDSESGEIATQTVPDPTQFYYLRLVAAAVAESDSRALGWVLADNAYCIGTSLVPDFPGALPRGFRGE